MFIGRVLARNPIRSFTTMRGTGNLAEIHITDAGCDSMRDTIFNEGVETFYDTDKPGNSCTFSLGRIKHANQAFAPQGSSFEATFDDRAHVYHVTNDSAISTEPAFTFTLLRDLHPLATQASITLIGVIHALGGTKRVASKKGKCVDKTDIVLVDDTAAKLVCTEWQFLARQTTDSCKGQVLLIVCVGVWAGGGGDCRTTMERDLSISG
ncbi:hypothetical protein PC128_g20901 [Phytophthora cactorum]|nr:hypothetical protein PC128_g20901 [Phytophthora cactorum]